ncbi:hypothetical protein SEA_SONALI_68 [Arthrobacter phage Sonali]|uniref:Uncharacterized protein n=1 Tax=Arthrobacter phage Sonali TaxID=2510495 RepID=A0A411CQW7_9CAUD|nr:hypothetical protein HOV09_gp68 [Arthrobacter phage Sonali]QAY16180.1 hypothetical protein SEA_SONALI_68 [Arthrobacter phage Sonali]
MSQANPHQPSTGTRHLHCTADGCHFTLQRPAASPNSTPGDFENFWLGKFIDYHSGQFEPGRAPDIAVDWEISACCSVCPDGIGDIEVIDSDTIQCKDCRTTWDMTGSNGDREETQA